MVHGESQNAGGRMNDDPIEYQIFRRQDGKSIPGKPEKEVIFVGCNGIRHVSFVERARFDALGIRSTSVQSSQVVGSCDGQCDQSPLGTFTFVER